MKNKLLWLGGAVLLGVVVYEEFFAHGAVPAGYFAQNVAPGAITVPMQGGSQYAFVLPAGAKWASQIAAGPNWPTVHATAGSNAPGLLVQQGPGPVAMQWVDANGTTQTTVATIT